MLWALFIACGQFVAAEDVEALGTGECEDFSAEVDLPDREELATASHLGHYGLTGLLATHSYDEQWSGGTVRSVAYTDMLATDDAGITLADSLANMAAVDPAELDGQAEQFAFWMNLYNGWAIQGALSQLAVDASWAGASASTWNGEETGTSWVMFVTRFVQVGGLELSLDEVEHGVMRGAWDEAAYADEPERLAQIQAWHQALWGDGPVDARLHMGINCVSRSCPDVPPGAFTADNVYDLLDANAVRFTAHGGKGAGPDGVSQLFSWFAGDFETSFGSVEAFVQQYREGGDADVAYGSTLDYDWALNGQ